jgi:dTDP-4-amino-4,6-dideoxy-D-galactose acyltransferase
MITNNMNDSRKNIFHRYSEFSVDRAVDKRKIIFGLDVKFRNNKIFKFSSGSAEILFYYRINNWESNFFEVQSIFLDYISIEEFEFFHVQKGLEDFMKFLKSQLDGNFIITSEIPSEDNNIIQLLNHFKFRTIETRLHYLKNDFGDYVHERFNVRDADSSDIANLKRTASYMRNAYDRFHSDWSFDLNRADSYLETYIENSINGFSDVVLVPNDTNIKSDSFLTANFCKNEWEALDYKISKMVLSAVSSETNRGWYIKLISEMIYRLKNEGAESIFMNTQSTNIAVIHTWEKLGFKLGRVTHLLSWNSLIN